VEANPDKGFNYGYYYYIPRSIRNAPKKYLLVEPNNTGIASDDMAVQDAATKNNMSLAKIYVDEVGCVALVPVFPRPESNWRMYTHDLDRDTLMNKTGLMARLDLQLIQMILDLREKCQNMGINLEPKFLMDGYSASSHFVNRFAAIHPELVQAVAAGGINCMPILPVAAMDGERLIYHIGIADLEEITGTPFNLELYKAIPQFFYMGAEDTNDTMPGLSSDAWDQEERRIIIKVLGEDMFGRWPKVMRVYEEQGCSAVTFKVYPGIGHEITSETIRDVVAFLRSNM